MFKTILEIEGKTYPLTSINLGSYNRGSGYDPSPNDHSLQLQIKTIKMDQFIWDWVNSADVTKKNGKVKILNMEENTVLQTISFDNGFSSLFNLSFYQNNEYSNETSITLAASKITITVNSPVTAVPSAKKD